MRPEILMNLPSIKKVGAEGQNPVQIKNAVVVQALTNPNQVSEFTVMLLAYNTTLHCII
jgi:hypothetical protein